MKFLLFLALLLPAAVQGQKSALELYRRHKFACDQETTTNGINVCSLDRLNFADSLMQRVYQRKLNALSKGVKESASAYLRATRDGSDSSKRAFFKKETEYYTSLKQLLVQSQRAWIKVRDLNYDIARKGCEGGTGCPAIANAIYIEDTLDRIRRLESPDFL